MHMSESDIRSFFKRFEYYYWETVHLFNGTIRNVGYSYELHGDILRITIKYTLYPGSSPIDVEDFKREMERGASKAEAETYCIYMPSLEFVRR